MIPENEIPARVEALRTQLHTACVGEDLAIVYCAVLNTLGGILEHLRHRMPPEVFEASCEEVRSLPEKVREVLDRAAPTPH